MQRYPKVVLACFLVVAACSENPAAPDEANVRGITLSTAVSSIAVTNNSDAGPGSFRDAIATANGDASITSIKFAKDLGPISILQVVTFTGAQELEIDGHGNDITGAALAPGEDAFVGNGGGELTLRRLTFRDAPGMGIKILVPSTQTGIVEVTFKDVIARNNGLMGALINDQSGYLVDPSSTSPDGSDAGLKVRISHSRFTNNGFGDIDMDGLRVNEGGLGDLDAVVSHSEVIANGGDGVEFDERGAGSVIFAVNHSQLDRNGAFTAADFDDGIDVDESGEGGIDARFDHVVANDNFEQGVDLNENDAGDLRVSMSHVEASDNDEEGIEFEEDDDFAGGGDIIADLKSVTTLRNGVNDGDAGLKLREKGAGNLFAEIEKHVSSDNFVAGILIREDAAGNLEATVKNAVASRNTGDGIKFDENSSGDLKGDVLRATASDNSGAGVAAEQATTGTGILRIKDLAATGNTLGPVTNDAGVTVSF